MVLPEGLIHTVVLLLSISAASIPLYLYLHASRKRPQDEHPAMAYLLQCQVSHSRLLPPDARHSFRYPTISLLVSLSQLEQRALDCGGGWIFGYGGTWWRLLGMRSPAYLFQDDRPIREKLLQALEPSIKNGKDRLGEVWLQSMPSYLGWEGINPLSVFYCYEKNEPERMFAVVLEVHNTFSERHLYVLEAGYKEGVARNPYDHRWTFPRQFHVSPFNDRSGAYICDLKQPSHPPTDPTGAPPMPGIRLTQLTDGPSPKPKLVAIFEPTLALPLTTANVIYSVINRPMTLFLTMPRILYEAARLHYIKKLDVYPRPVPVPWQTQIKDGLEPDRNPIAADIMNTSGTIVWEEETWTERYARSRVEKFLHRRLKLQPLRVRFIPANPSVPPWEISHEEPTHTLEITYRSPQFFLALLTATDADQALLLGSHADRLFRASPPALFTLVFAPYWGTYPEPSAVEDIAHRLRLLTIPPSKRVDWLAHPLDDPQDWSLVFVLFVVQVSALLQKYVFNVLGARFVSGEAPWMAWERVTTHSKPLKDAAGSVRHEEGRPEHIMLASSN